MEGKIRSISIKMTSAISKYVEQLDSLVIIINETEQRIIGDSPDQFVSVNANFFTKSFLVVMCAYIESYIKDAMMVIVDDTNSKLAISKIPRNLVKWGFDVKKDLHANDSLYEHLKLDIKKAQLDDYISGHPYKAVNLFKNFGIDLESDESFAAQRELIKIIVIRRNRVVHHNDQASDLSMDDLRHYIFQIKEYLINLDTIVHLHCNP